MPTPQVPIGSGFGPATTASDVIRGSDLTNKVAIVTGAIRASALRLLGPFSAVARKSLFLLGTTRKPRMR